MRRTDHRTGAGTWVVRTGWVVMGSSEPRS